MKEKLGEPGLCHEGDRQRPADGGSALSANLPIARLLMTATRDDYEVCWSHGHLSRECRVGFWSHGHLSRDLQVDSRINEFRFRCSEELTMLVGESARRIKMHFENTLVEALNLHES